MADYNINSGNLTSLGTDSADNFYFRTGGAPNVVINALGGNDSVYIQETSQGAESNALEGLYAALQGGADYLYASGDFTSTAATIRAGFGGDTLTFKGGDSNFTDLQLKLADGSDSLNLAFSATTTSTIEGGAGADTVVLTGGTITDSSILLGAGVDNLTVDNSAATDTYFELGGGADVANLDIIALSDVTVGAGADDDLIALSADALGESLFNLGGGLDTINVTAGSGVVTILGGADNDNLNFLSNSVNLLTDSVIRGDAGNDSIYFSGGSYTSVSVFGGVGADTINIANIASTSTEEELVLTYASQADSNLDSFDYINASAGQTAVISTPALSLQTTSDGQYEGFRIVDGVALFTSGSPTLAEAVASLDDVLNVGQAVAFSAQGTDGQGGNLNNNTYIFIQGGNLQNSPVLDDYVIMTDQTNYTEVANGNLEVRYS